jgi:hypothetical protein
MSPRLRRAGGSLAIFLGASTVTSLFFINFCGTVFQCGCQSLWSGADAHCNIHNPTGRHCPWCAVGAAGQYSIYGAMVVAQALLSHLPLVWNWPRRLAATLLAFPMIGLIAAWVLGWTTGYWDQ